MTRREGVARSNQQNEAQINDKANEINVQNLLEIFEGCGLIRLQEIVVSLSKNVFDDILQLPNFEVNIQDLILPTLNLAIVQKTYQLFQINNDKLTIRKQINSIISHSENPQILQLANDIQNKSHDEIISDKDFIEFILEDLQLQIGLSFYTFDGQNFEPTYIGEYLEQIKQSLKNLLLQSKQNTNQKETPVLNLKKELRSLIAEKKFTISKQSTEFIEYCQSTAILGSVIFALQRIAEHQFNYPSLNRHKVRNNIGFLEIGDWIYILSISHRLITREKDDHLLITFIGDPHQLPDYKK